MILYHFNLRSKEQDTLDTNRRILVTLNVASVLKSFGHGSSYVSGSWYAHMESRSFLYISIRQTYLPFLTLSWTTIYGKGRFSTFVFLNKQHCKHILTSWWLGMHALQTSLVKLKCASDATNSIEIKVKRYKLPKQLHWGRIINNMISYRFNALSKNHFPERWCF